MCRVGSLKVVVIGSHNLDIFRRSIESILKALPSNASLYIHLNGPQTDKEVWLSALNDSRVEVSQSKATHVPLIRNGFLNRLKNSIVYFLDDDVEVPKDFFVKIQTFFSAFPQTAVIGGPNITPPWSSFSERLFGAVLTSPFAAPFVFKRYAVTTGTEKKQATDFDISTCNMGVNTTLLPTSIRFHETLYPNDENLFLYEIAKRKLHVRRLASNFVYHHRRSNYFSFLKQVYGYGIGRAKQTLLAPKSFERHLFVFVSVVFFVLITVPASKSLIFLYVIASMIGWLFSKEARQTGLVGLIVSPLLTLSLHLTYFSGLLKGLCFPRRLIRHSHLLAHE